MDILQQNNWHIKLSIKHLIMKKNYRLIYASMVNGSPKESISVHYSVSYTKQKRIKVDATSTPKRDEEEGETIEHWYRGITSDMFG